MTRGQAREIVRRVARSLVVRTLARALASARRDWRRVHQAADRYEGRLKRIFKKSFSEGRRAVDNKALRRALTLRDEIGVLSEMSKAIDVFQQELGYDQNNSDAPLTVALYDTLVASARGTEKSLKSRLRAAAPSPAEIKGFKFDETNPEALRWARERAAELIGELSDADRRAIRELVEEAFEEQFDVDELADRIADIIGDDERAEVIARTEAMRAANEGQQQLWSQAVEEGLLTGTEEKEWIVTPDDRLCPLCEPLDGKTVPLKDEFETEQGKIDGPPLHPRCRCTLGLSA